MSTIGFIGLGIMGRPMVAHLIKGGHRVHTAIHTTAAPAALVDMGLSVLATPRAVAAESDIVITMVPDTPQVEEVLFGINGVAEGLSPGKLIIDMSSISPIETKHFAARISDVKCDYLDAPVSGGEVGATNASLTIMVGGTEAAFIRAKPIFELMGKNITLVGGSGAGQTTKVANQIIVALTIEAVAEALVFSSKAGVDPDKVRNALMGGLASSRILELHGDRMIRRTFNPGFRIRLHQKDLNLALSGAHALGVALPNTASTAQLFQAATAHGAAELDHWAIVMTLEQMAGQKMR